ncbi:hypothetical protein R3P38DRAFT_2762776 [Favolaschia claudopus]|uniref:Uncharacterized protein n=1 Tax=Favolaschia claudopus TaxID=2862362 RepID=A0AAW0DMH0_9AGAR
MGESLFRVAAHLQTWKIAASGLLTPTSSSSLKRGRREKVKIPSPVSKIRGSFSVVIQLKALRTDGESLNNFEEGSDRENGMNVTGRKAALHLGVGWSLVEKRNRLKTSESKYYGSSSNLERRTKAFIIKNSQATMVRNASRRVPVEGQTQGMPPPLRWDYGLLIDYLQRQQVEKATQAVYALHEAGSYTAICSRETRIISFPWGKIVDFSALAMCCNLHGTGLTRFATAKNWPECKVYLLLSTQCPPREKEETSPRAAIYDAASANVQHDRTKNEHSARMSMDGRSSFGQQDYYWRPL